MEVKKNIRRDRFKVLMKRLEKQNKEFEKFSRQDKRCVIAQDCIDRIAAKQFIGSSGVYTNVPPEFFNTSEDVKSTINSSCDVKCDVCAKGGLFMSYIGRTNNITFKELRHGNDQIIDKLSGIFDVSNLDLMEAAFEENMVNEWNSCSRYETQYSEEYRESLSKKMGIKYASDNDALISICKNIIKNKGFFDPTDIVHPNLSISFRNW